MAGYRVESWRASVRLSSRRPSVLHSFVRLTSWRGDPPCGARLRVARRLHRLAATAKQFETQRDQVEAQALGQRLHQPLVFRVLKLDHLACVDIDQMVVMALFS